MLNAISTFIKQYIKKIVNISFSFIEKHYIVDNSVRSASKIIIYIFSFWFFIAIFVSISFTDIIAVWNLKNYKPPLPSELLDRKGRLISTFFRDNRTLVPYKALPKHLTQAFIAMEDNHFYSHIGFDFPAFVRAFIANLQSGSIKQGGSTITQQLTKVILTDRSRTYTRKIKELVLAITIDLFYTKEEILHLYFNQIYFGHGNYGVQAASQFYFNKDAKHLTLGESCILATLPAAPNKYSPIKNPKLSLNRLTYGLLKMIDMGFINKRQATVHFQQILSYYKNLNASPTSTAFGVREDKAPFFTEFMRKDLENELGKENLYTKGYKIYSSLDLDHQLIAEKVLNSALKRQNIVSKDYIFNKHTELAAAYSPVLSLLQLAFDTPNFKVRKSLNQYKIEIEFQKELSDKLEILNLGIGGEYNLDQFLARARKNNLFQNRYISVEGAFIELDHKTGEITAMVGGREFNSVNQINRAVQIKRQPGSTFKALIFASALETKKVTAATIFPDSPMIFLNQEGESWIPENYSDGYRGFISLREALTYSVNMVSIAVSKEVKLSSLLSNITKMLNVPRNAIPYNLSVALGTYEVSPLQMAGAFAIFPRGGETLPIRYYSKILDQNYKTIKSKSKYIKGNKVLSTSTTSIMTSMLEDVIAKGTGTKVRSSGYEGFAAGKTGTSQNFKDAWFVGYNDRYTSAVWLGYDRSVLSLGSGQTGGNIAAPIWGEYQAKIAPFRQEGQIKYPNSEDAYLISGDTHNAMICPDTGQQISSHCSCNGAYSEMFVPNTIPQPSADCKKLLETQDVAKERENLLNKNPSHEDFFKGDDF